MPTYNQSRRTAAYRLAALLASLLAASVAPQQSPAARPPSPLAVIALTPVPAGTDALALHATVRGQEGFFLFDTGGGVTVISPDFVRRIGGKPWGQLTGYQLDGNRIDSPRCDDITFDMTGRQFLCPIAAVFDIGGFLPPGAPHLDGSMGMDLFAGQAITLSIASKRLIVESPASLRARIHGATETPIRLVRDAEGVALTVNAAVPTSAGMAWMEVDSGNGGSLLIGKHLAALMGLNPDTKAPQPLRFRLAGGIPVEGNARIVDHMIMDGNIGARFLEHWDLTLDLKNGRAWMQPARVSSPAAGP